MNTDHQNNPYITSFGPRFDVESAVDLGFFEPAATFDPPTLLDTGKHYRAEREANLSALYGSPLSHGAQQAEAIAKAHERLGFDSVGFLTVGFAEGHRRLYVHKDGRWFEGEV